MPPAPKKAVCVYCGSRSGDDPSFEAAADALGRGIARAGWQLVYGAGDVGLMGTVARAVQAEGGDTLGVIPQHLMKMEVGKRDLTAFVVTETMHERKKVMFLNGDAVVALPGGPGTLDELFEVLTWRQLGLHAKPVILVNESGYWDPLIALIDHLVARGFAPEAFRGYLTVVPDAGAALETLREAFG